MGLLPDGDGLRKSSHALAKAAPGLRLNEHIEANGPTVFAHACKMGLEGIVSKRKDSTYRSGRSSDWLKMKNPACAAARREAAEDWGESPTHYARRASAAAGLNLALAWFIYAWANHPSLSILLRREFQTGQHDHICPARAQPS